MRKYIAILAALVLSFSMPSFAQDASMDETGIEAAIIAVVNDSESIEDAIVLLLSEEDTTLTDAQKNALRDLPEDARIFFINTVIDGTTTVDTALLVATQQGVTNEMGEELYNAFSPELVNFIEDDAEGNLLETAAGPTSSGPIGVGVGAGGADLTGASDAGPRRQSGWGDQGVRRRPRRLDRSVHGDQHGSLSGGADLARGMDPSARTQCPWRAGRRRAAGL